VGAIPEVQLKIVVIGAGIVGVATAYEFAERGHEVTLVERREGAALETSYANGGQLCASEVAPWAGPEVPWRALKWMGRADAPFRLRLKPDPEQWLWLLRFLMRCRASARAERVLPNLALALLTRARVDAIAEKARAGGMPISFGEERRGVMQLFHDRHSLDEASAAADATRRAGLEQRVLSAAECAEIEPALGPAMQRGRIAGGLYCESDRSGDARLFTQALAKMCEAMGVRFVTGAEIERFETEGGRVTGVRTNGRLFGGDVFVLAAGVSTARLARQLGLRIPVYPLKGYSVTLPVGDALAPHVSMTDEERRIVVSRFGDRLRVAGTAEVCGYDMTLEMPRARSVLASLLDLLPQMGERAGEAEFWTGLRPMSADGSPIVGRAGAYANVWLNTGHGSIGWTLGAGSAAALADAVCGSAPQVDLSAFALTRFSLI